MGIVIVEGGGGKERFQDGGWRISTHALSMSMPWHSILLSVAIRAPVERHDACHSGALIIRAPRNASRVVTSWRGAFE
ncbi:hypothetical protein OG588_31930 [Streptomyces prunicolor]|uniref:hypothetical protein n=1 Tax=Streptomyces prunicolor TaxID=67348 RepID=UPI00386E4D60|nr:hypothetical protein OG588_31930 [Streptomyces prunicolor]